MQGLQRLSEQGETLIAPMPVTAQDSAAAPGYEAIDSGEGIDWDESGRRTQKRPSCTSGCCFNAVVAAVILLNMVFLWLEADLGVLGLEAARKDFLARDVALFGGSASVQQGVTQGIEAASAEDARAKQNLQHILKDKTHFEGDLNKDTDVQQGDPRIRGMAYNIIELCFIGFYTIELIMRVMDLGCMGYLTDPLGLLDLVVVISGWLDILLPVLLHRHNVDNSELSPHELFTLSVLRTMRVLRVFRIFRVSRTLRVLGRALAYAMAVVFWVMILVLLVNFVLGMLLTTYIGQRSILWGEHEEAILDLFGSVGRSMATLFGIMTLTGWIEIAELVSQVYPATITVPCFAMYAVLFPFTLIALTSGSLCDLFMSAQRKDEQWRVQKLHARRAAMTTELFDLFVKSSPAKAGYLSREEFENLLALRTERIVEHLELIEIFTDDDELMQLFDSLLQDAPTRLEGVVEIVTLAEAITHMSGFAEAPSVVSIKHTVTNMRNEQASRNAKAATETEARQNDSRLHQQQMAAVRQDIGGVSDKLERARKADEAVRTQAEEQKELLKNKLDGMATALASQGTALSKLDIIATLVTKQADASDALTAITSQLREVNERTESLAKLVNSLASKEVAESVSTASS